MDCKKCCVGDDQSLDVKVDESRTAPGMAIMDPSLEQTIPMPDHYVKKEKKDRQSAKKDDVPLLQPEEKQPLPPPQEARPEKDEKAEKKKRAKEENEAQMKEAANQEKNKAVAGSEGVGPKDHKFRSEKAKRGQEYTVTVDKGDGGELGIDLDRSDGRDLRVVRIKPGLFSKWNDENKGKLKPGHIFVGANGKSSSLDEIVQELKTQTRNEVLVRTESEYRMGLKKNGERLGIDLDQKNYITLVVNSISEGLIQEWNKVAPEGCRMEVDDFIVEVNGIRGVATDMLAAFQDNDELDILFVKRGDEGQ